MKVIYKFPLKNLTEQTIRVPSRNEYLTIHIQRGIYYVWFEVDDTTPLIDMTIFRYGTGSYHSFDRQRYLTTVFEYGDRLVWHFYLKLPDIRGQYVDCAGDGTAINKKLPDIFPHKSSMLPLP